MVFYVKAVVAATFYSASRSLRAVFAGDRFKKQIEKIKDHLHFLIIILEFIVKIFRKVIKRLTSPFLFC